MTEQEKKTLFSLTPAELANVLALKRGTDYWVKTIYQKLYHSGEFPSAALELRPDVARRLKNYEISWPQIKSLLRAPDGTVKWLIAYNDGAMVELVLMSYDKRHTVCVSTQCGCAMGCTFCATGKMGFKRHLNAGEIVMEVLIARQELAKKGAALTNVVFMGMGEPLANYEEVMRAAAIISSDIGLAIAPRHITISTAGLPAGIYRMAQEKAGYQLAVSLHSAIDSVREKLMPIAKTHNLESLLAACREYNSLTKRRVFFEYAVMAGINDSPKDIEALAAFIHRLNGHVNLLSWNKVDEVPFKSADTKRLLAIQAELEKRGVRALIRESRGAEIAAACGQLYAAAEQKQ